MLQAEVVRRSDGRVIVLVNHETELDLFGG